MKKFDIITIFPNSLESYFATSILKRAQFRKLIKITTHDLRKWAKDKHQTVDDKPYGGGAGMLMMAEPILKAVKAIKKSKRTKIIVLSAKGNQFNQKTAYQLAKNYDQIIFISGRYEGIDERVKNILKADEVSIGPYITTDGEVTSAVIISAVARLVPGTIKLQSLAEESHWNAQLRQGEIKNKLEYPHYTRPEVIAWQGKKYKVPQVLLKGNHKKIAEWRKNKSK